jgi:diguanylate cyclase (GGDEF)-like protein
MSYTNMVSGIKFRVAAAVVVSALLVGCAVAGTHHPQLLWLMAGAALAWVAMELRARGLLRQRDKLVASLAERTEQLRKEQAALASVQKELQLQATHDSLTGLWNRAAILEQLERELVRAQREQTVLAVAIADLDHFKLINDTQGHSCGDRVLRDAAQRLSYCLREYDTIGRYGGEEFLILMPGYDPAESSSRLDDLVASIREHRFLDGERVVQTSCSFGATVFRPEGRGASIEELLAAADAALYRARAAGRNCVSFAEHAALRRSVGRA